MITNNPCRIISNCINFPKPKTDLKGWGKEEILVNCDDYCCKFLDFNANTKGSMHYHLSKHETWYILYGEIELIFINTYDASREIKILSAGDMVDIPRNCPHQVRALAETRILEVSTRHFEHDSYRIEPGDSQTLK